MTFTFIDAFAGAGGLSLGLHLAGGKSLFAFDTDPVACATLERNLGGRVQTVPLSEVDPVELLEAVGRPDVVVGGPPCQGFSMQRRGERSDPRNDLVADYFRFALAMRPKVVVMENVPGVLGVRGETYMAVVRQLVSSAGYEMTSRVIDVATLGVPQRRRRAIVVAWDASRVDEFDFDAMIGVHPVRTVRDAFAGLPEPPEDFTEHPKYPNHTRARMSALNLERISHVPEGGGRLDIPEHLQMDCHRGSDHRHLDVFGRLSWDLPAGTVTAMFDNFTRGRFAHPDHDRNITNREGARLQSFPDWYVFSGAKKEVARQIGNAVPPLLGQALGEELTRRLATPVEARSLPEAARG